MDVAYDHIQEETLADHESETGDKKTETSGGLNSEFQEAFKAVSASPWGARLGGFLGQVKKQGESLYSEAQKEYSNASSQASKGLTDLTSSIVQKTRDLNISQGEGTFTDPFFDLPEHAKPKADAASTDGEPSTTDPANAADTSAEHAESLPADILKEATSIASRFKPEAAKWLKEAQKAEDAADEALLKFGTNVRNFLRDTITVTAPDAAAAAGLPIPAGWTRGGAGSGSRAPEVLFETNDAEGRRVFHSNRFDAQLHVIHQSPDRFLTDPEGGGDEWASWTEGFDADKMTDRVAADLDKYLDLRRTMERLVPDKVDYANFWRRYYFLRKAVEEEEKKRREVLKGAVEGSEEDVDWGEDDDDDDDEAEASDSSTPKRTDGATPASTTAAADASSSTLGAPPKAVAKGSGKKDHLSPRRSQEGSDASYDIVSGATTQTAGSPKDEGKKQHADAGAGEPGAKKAESDEEDWE